MPEVGLQARISVEYIFWRTSDVDAYFARLRNGGIRSIAHASQAYQLFDPLKSQNADFNNHVQSPVGALATALTRYFIFHKIKPMTFWSIEV